MQRILRSLVLLAALAAAVTLAACGGEDEAASQDVNTLLTETFSGDKDVKSGTLAMSANIEVSGGGSQLQGPLSIKLGGPFQSQGEGKLPKFDIDLDFSGAGQSVKAGVTSTGDKGFVNWMGQEYAVSDEVFQQFVQGYEQSAKQGGQQDQSLQSLGLDPRKWLTNPQNAGEAKVGDDDVIKITGGVNVSALLEDLNTALSKAGQLGLQGQAQLPSKLTEEQRKQVEEAVKDVRVEIYTGAEDKILRRIMIAMNLDAKEQGSGKVSFDLSILDLNEDQTIEAPESTKPFDQLLGQLGGLGSLLGGGGAGGLGGAGGSGSGSGSGDSGSGGGTAPSAADLEKYTQCVEEAGNDVAKAQKCADLITP